MKNIQTIVSDLDDTLLNEHSKLSDYTIQVLKKCTERGIRVIPASGRMQHSVTAFVEQLATHQPYICGNGAEILSSDHQIMYRCDIPLDTAKQIIRYMEERNIYIQTYRDDCFYYSVASPAAEDYMRLTLLQAKKVDNLADWLDFPVPKLLCIMDPALVRKMLPEVREVFHGLVDVTSSCPNYLEIGAPGVSKGNALQKLSELIGFTPETTVTFGDSLNDLSMLTWTPNGVAVGNARREVLQTVNYVCGLNTEDGVAHFIEREVLGE